MFSAIVGALVSICVGIGINETAKAIERKAENTAKEKKVDPVTLSGIMNEIYTAAKKKGIETVNLLNEKLASINSGVLYQNPTVKSYINKARAKVNSNITKVNQDLADIDSIVNTVEGKVNAFNSMTSDYKTSEEGLKTADSVKKMADEGKFEIAQIAGGFENYEKTV